MNSLPTELLSLIFINVLPSCLDDARYHRFDDPAALHASISCVCQQWNRIAKSTPRLWTFIKVSNKAKSHDAMKRRLELSGSSLLDISIRLSRNEDEDNYWGDFKDSDDFAESDLGPQLDRALECANAKNPFYETHALLVKQVSRWNTLRVQADVGVPSDLRQWIPSQLPNVVGLSLGFAAHELATEYQKMPFISAPRLTFCALDCPMFFPLAHCPLLQEYHTAGVGFLDFIPPTLSSVFREIVEALSRECPQLKVLQVGVDSRHFRSRFNNVVQKDWPALPSLTTLRFAQGVDFLSFRCILSKLKAPRLHRLEFRDSFFTHDSIPEIPFPVKNEGVISFSTMCADEVRVLLPQIPNAADLQVELDVDSLFDGDPKFRDAETWELARDTEAISALQEWWQWVLQNTSKVSWVVPSDDGEGEESWKRLGGPELSFDDAIAYLDRRRIVWLNTQKYYKQPWPACLS